jgi:hypothetical protein
MIARDYLVLFLLSLVVLIVVACLLPVPGYMDAEYYYAGGLQLVTGEGFTEPYLWNYLNDPDGLPTPSHAYWMPLASLLSALGMFVSGSKLFAAARSVFLLLGATVPLVTASLAYALNPNRQGAILAGLLAVFSGFYLPVMTTTDTFAIYMLLGGIFFLLLPRLENSSSLWPGLILGILTGWMHLARTDGIIWFAAAILAVIALGMRQKHTGGSTQNRSLILQLGAIILGYVLVMGPWMLHNLSVFGTLLSPAGTRPFWLVSYDDMFSYPASQLTFERWRTSGAIGKNILWALGINLQRTLAEQGMIFLLPLILMGLWSKRGDSRLRIGLFLWTLTLVVMTIVFPLAGARGGYFHSSAAFLPLFWAVVPLGLEMLIGFFTRLRGWHLEPAWKVFGYALVGFAVLLSSFVILGKVTGSADPAFSWIGRERKFEQIGKLLPNYGATSDDIVVITDPPGYYVATGHPGIPIPNGNVALVLAVAEKFHARYLLLESHHPLGLENLYNDPQNPPIGLCYLFRVDDTYIFDLTP